MLMHSYIFSSSDEKATSTPDGPTLTTAVPPPPTALLPANTIITAADMADSNSPHPSQPLEINAVLPSPPDINLDTQTLPNLPSAEEKILTSIHSSDSVELMAVTCVEPTKNSVNSSEKSPITSGGVSSIRPAIASQEIPQPNPTALYTDAISTNNGGVTRLCSTLSGPKLAWDNVGDDQDVSMMDGTSGALPSPKPWNYDDLPPWLTSMIVYLHGVAEDAAWQDLIIHFVEFEKSGPPNGVSFIVLSLIVN